MIAVNRHEMVFCNLGLHLQVSLTPMIARRPATSSKETLLSRYCVTLGELSLRRQTELALMASKLETELASRAKSSFLGTMSHELRTPLNAIIGFSEIITNMRPEDHADAKGAEYSEQITKAGRHMLGVISDILDISKIESGTFQLNIDAYALSEIIEDSLPLVRDRIAAKQQILEVRLPKNLPEVEVDARRIRQILINVLTNASKFTPERGRIIFVARRTKDGGATIAIADSGIGMTPEQMATAMTPFGQIHSHLSRTEDGTGLGLPIARGLARQHGGDLYIESEPGKGTTVVLTLRASAAAPVGAVAISAPGGGERSKARKATAPTPKDRKS